MKQRNYINITIIIIFLLCLSGCAGKSKLDPMPPPDTRSVLLTLKIRHDLVETIRSMMSFKISTKGKGGEVRGFLNYAKPDKLGIYIMGPFNEPRVIATVVGESLKVYFVVENELIDDQLTDDAIKRMFDIDLRISDIRSAIFANPFLDGNTKDLELQAYEDEFLITRPSTRENCIEEISVIAKDTAINKWRIKDTTGKIIQEISFSKYREIGGVLRPLKAVVYRPEDNTSITIESIDPEINVNLADDVFQFSVPDNVEIYKFKSKVP